MHGNVAGEPAMSRGISREQNEQQNRLGVLTDNSTHASAETGVSVSPTSVVLTGDSLSLIHI